MAAVVSHTIKSDWFKFDGPAPTQYIRRQSNSWASICTRRAKLRGTSTRVM